MGLILSAMAGNEMAKEKREAARRKEDFVLENGKRQERTKEDSGEAGGTTITRRLHTHFMFSRHPSHRRHVASAKTCALQVAATGTNGSFHRRMQDPSHPYDYEYRSIRHSEWSTPATDMYATRKHLHSRLSKIDCVM